MMKTRKQTRLKNYDYASAGWYYITVCTNNRECMFGNIINGKMKLNKYGKIIQNVWQSLPQHHSVKLDGFQIMPNHVHFVINIVGARFPRPNAGSSRPQSGSSRPTLGQIVAYFKYQSTKQINILRQTPGKRLFQRNYYEHVIRNHQSLNEIREYIKNNSKNWETDRNNPNPRKS